MRNLFFIFLVLSFCSVNAETTELFQLGDAARFALRFDTKTGNLQEIVYNGKTLTVPVAEVQQFDIRQNNDWQFGKNKLEFLGFEKQDGNKESSKTAAVQKCGDWTVKLFYEINPNTATLKRSAELVYTGKENTKIKGFWFSLPIFTCGADTQFITPGQYPPKIFYTDERPDSSPKGEGNYSAFPDGSSRGMQRNAVSAIQLTDSVSCFTLTDVLVPYADRCGGDISRRNGNLRIAQSFDTVGHVKPNDKVYIGDAYIRFVDGNFETALTKIHGLMRELGQTPPKDRPKWFEEAILYSYHPGGTIGSQCKDLGGFKPATELLDSIKQLGCNSIWLMPLEDKSIYHPRDYYKFQAGLGTTPEAAAAEYKTLVNKAHELGLHVLQDSVPHGGGNPNERSIAHPEWLVQDEDGKTLDYWGFDFNSPNWIDYMGGVSTHYVKNYGIDGYRVDACGGSKIPNWNPEIPYQRASYSQSQGGLNMLRKIRQAVKEQNKDGGILAEVHTGIWGAVSDATYDFDLCYNVLHDARKLPADEFVPRLRRWLHEQQYSEIPDMLRLRHVESHDSLRSQLWYGTEPHRKLMALTAFIHGIPLVYHEEETGHLFEFRQIFEIRKALPELNGGDADYVSVDAPPGVFAVLRTKGDDASIVVINFNDKPVVRGKIRLAWEKLPEGLRKQNAIRSLCANAKREFDSTLKKGNELVFDDVLLNEVIVLRKNEDKKLQEQVSGIFSTGVSAAQSPLGIKISNGFGEAEIILPEDVAAKSENKVVTKNKERKTITQKFGDAILTTNYITQKDGNITVESSWSGQNIPKTAALAIPILKADLYSIATSGGLLPYQRLDGQYVPRHLTTDGINGSIYWRPQGTNVVFDSLLEPLVRTINFSDSAGIEFADSNPLRVRLLDRIGGKKQLTLLINYTDETLPKLPSKPEIRFTIGADIAKHTESPLIQSSLMNYFRPAIGGYVFENEFYKLRLTRSGTVMSLTKPVSGGTCSAIHQSDIYTDYGYGKEKLRYAAGNDVEAGCRIVQDGDTLRLRFEGQLRGNGRFDLMHPPVEYFTEYALKKDSPAIGFSCGIKTPRVPNENNGFLALFVPMPNVKSFAYFGKDGKLIAEGTNENAKGRSYQTSGVMPERIVLKDENNTLLELTELKGEASNVFLDRQNFFIAFDDGKNIGKPNVWRTFTATLYTDKNHGSVSAPVIFGSVSASAARLNDELLNDGGFESGLSNGNLVSLQTGEVVIKGKSQATSWRVPQNGLISDTEKHSGKCSAQVNGKAEQYDLFAQDIPLKDLKVGTKLRLTAWVKGNALVKGKEGWQVGCVRFAAVVNGETHYISSPPLLETFDWKEVAVEWTVPENTHKLTAEVGNNGAAGTIWVDDVKIEKR